MILRRRLLDIARNIAGGEDVIQGSFVPDEATLEYTIDIGFDCRMLLIWMDDDENAIGNGHKNVILILADLVSNKQYCISTNNGGTTPNGLIPGLITTSSTKVTKNGTEITFQSTAQYGNVFGYFEPVKYNYVAW